MPSDSLDFSEPPELAELRRRAHEVAVDAARRYGACNDSWLRGFSREFSVELGRLGWIGLTWPKEMGGGGRPGIERLVIAEEMISAGAPIAASWFADRQIGPSLISFGTPEQQDRFLPSMLNGSEYWCIGMSEPGAGSDLAGVTTRAHQEGDRFRINGQKIWTSGAASSEYCYLICRTSGSPGSHTGMSEIIVPLAARGVEVRPIRDLTGSNHFCEVYFDDVVVPVSNLVGSEGHAFKQSMRQLERERGGIDRLMSNRRLYLLARERADTTDPVIRQQIAAIEGGYRIGRLLVAREVEGQARPGFSAITKVFCTEHEQRVANFISEVLAGEATLTHDLAEGVYYSPAYTIMGGTSTVLRNVIAERILGLPKP